MKEFIHDILYNEYGNDFQSFFDNSALIKYLDSKMGAIYGDSKTRRSLANIYAIYSILHFYVEDFYGDKEKYKRFTGYQYTTILHYSLFAVIYTAARKYKIML